MFNRWTVLALVLGAPILGCDTSPISERRDPTACHLVGCASGVSWTGTVTVSAQSEQAIRFVLCKNAQCRSATQVFDVTSASEGQDVGAPDLEAACSATPAPSVLVINCHFAYGVDELVDGDTYDLTLFDQANGAELASAHAAVKYVDEWPNGEECPPHCRVSSLDSAPDAQ